MPGSFVYPNHTRKASTRMHKNSDQTVSLLILGCDCLWIGHNIYWFSLIFLLCRVFFCLVLSRFVWSFTQLFTFHTHAHTHVHTHSVTHELKLNTIVLHLFLSTWLPTAYLSPEIATSIGPNKYSFVFFFHEILFIRCPFSLFRLYTAPQLLAW